MSRSPQRRSPCSYKNKQDCKAHEPMCQWDEKYNECGPGPMFSRDIEDKIYQYASDTALGQYPYYDLNYILERYPLSSIVELLNYLMDNEKEFNYILNRINSNTEILMSAAFNGYTDLVFYMIGLYKNDPEFKQAVIGHAILNATRAGHLDLVNKLISIPGNVDLDNIYNMSMVIAAQGGHLDIVNRMIGLGASNFDQAMEEAALNGHINIIERMIQLGSHNFNKSMMAAAEGGHINVINWLIQTGLVDDLNTLNDSMEIAADEGHADVVERLIELGADEFESAIFTAGSSGNIDIVDRMIDLGAANFHAVMEIAAELGHINVVDRMLQMGVNINFPMVVAANSGQLDVLNHVIELGANDFNESIETAAAAGQLHIVNRLLETGHQFNLHLLMSIAAQNGYIDIVKRMVELGVTNFDEAIGHAKREGYKEIVIFLQNKQKNKKKKGKKKYKN